MRSQADRIEAAHPVLPSSTVYNATLLAAIMEGDAKLANDGSSVCEDDLDAFGEQSG